MVTDEQLVRLIQIGERGGKDYQKVSKKIVEALKELRSRRRSDCGDYQSKRSLNANGLLWACIGEIAAEVGADRYTIYRLLLRRYGKSAYVCVKPEAVKDLLNKWRDCEDIGCITIDGSEYREVLCYYGSSTYNVKEFAALLNGTVSEMEELDIDPPSIERVEEAIAEWSKVR